MSSSGTSKNTPIAVSISGSTQSGKGPPYTVVLNPPGPYPVTAANSTLTLTLDSTSARAGFQMFGIGFRGDSKDASSQTQLTAVVSSTSSSKDTLTITDAYTIKHESFEFVMLYQNPTNDPMLARVYGYDPQVDNED